MEFSRQEYWNGLPLPSPGDLPDPGIELQSPALQMNSLPNEPPEVSMLDGDGHLINIYNKNCVKVYVSFSKN